ncbi:MAG TPA: glycosyltransferase family 4 protein [Solirubrobacteraceae bacterium]|jgi:glycosyltransferase involved in cell wall biosynthesis|nr:glycosyltransferase family 4 protein [Solirubrobacteraceae bacterium]
MRVLLCHQPTDGGVGRHIGDLIDGLSAAGHEVVVCSPALPAGVSSAARHVPLDLRRAIAPRADVAALVRFARVVRDVRPELIHAHSSKAGAIARLARLVRPRTPVVYTPHGYAFAGYFSRDSERLVYKAIERALAPLTSLVTCVCEAEARLARTVGPRKRVCVVHNGILPPPPGTPDPHVAALRARGPVIGALTQLRPGKGLETLIDAAPLVLERHAETQFAIVGDGPDLDELRERSRALGVERAVHFLGPSDEPLSVLRGMDIFVHPSWAEAFPYVILEAMALGLPIVASDVGGIGEAIVGGQSGLLVPPREEPALARALKELLDDHQAADRFGQAALERSARFTRAAMIERLVGAYAGVARPTAPLRPLLNARKRRSLPGHD